MAISTGSRGRVMAEINITPFTDVCLVLLIIFMVSASFIGQPKGVDVKLPSATHKATNALPAEDLTISLQKNGSLFVDNKSVTSNELYGALKDYASKSKVRNVVIKADQGIVYDQVVKVMDAVRESGMNYMSLAVQEAPTRPAGAGS